MPQANINNHKVRMYLNGGKVKSAHLCQNNQLTKVYSSAPDYLFSLGSFNTQYLTGFDNATAGYAIQLEAATGYATNGSTLTATAQATSLQAIDWADIEYITVVGYVSVTEGSFPGSRTGGGTVSVAGQVIPLNQRTRVNTRGVAPLVLDASATVKVNKGEKGLYRAIATVNIEKILTE